MPLASDRIIVTPLIGMGDTLMMTPALRMLKSALPGCHVTCVTINQGCHDVLLNNPYIDRLVLDPVSQTRAARSVAHILRRHAFRYDASVSFYPSNRFHYNLFAVLTCAPIRAGHRYRHCDMRACNWLRNRSIDEDISLHCVEENMRLLGVLDPRLETVEPGRLELHLTARELREGAALIPPGLPRPWIGLHAGCSTLKNHGRRRWPPHRFVELIDRFPEATFVLFGAHEDAEANRFISQRVARPGNIVLVEGKGIRQAAAAMAVLDAFVSNDSGLMHCAAAMNVPVVALVGPTAPALIHPWQVPHRVVRLGLACSPCFSYSPRPLACSLNDTYACMRDLPAGMVEAALCDLLRERPRDGA
jgi:ADP-heptose:LPS heptosyltransferase